MALLCIFLTFCGVCISLAELKNIKTTKHFNPLLPVEPRLVGDPPVNNGPLYQVSIRVHREGTILDALLMDHIGSGSLISSKCVLTASTVLYEGNDSGTYGIIRNPLPNSKDRLYVVAGTNSLMFDPSKTFLTAVKDVKTHNKPNKDDIVIAVLQLKIPAPIDNIKIGLIPMRSIATEAGEKCQIRGWGHAIEKFISPDIQNATVSIVENDVCTEKYYSRIDVEITSDMLCAGEQQNNIPYCQSDSGGPLVCNGELTGVFLWRHLCGITEYPEVYASVAHHRQWIADTIKEMDPSTPVLPTQSPHSTNKPPQPSFPPVSTLPPKTTTLTLPSSATKSTIDILTCASVLIVIPILM